LDFYGGAQLVGGGAQSFIRDGGDDGVEGLAELGLSRDGEIELHGIGGPSLPA
jgi:hypothetical protein